jgi:hypothetical protein
MLICTEKIRKFSEPMMMVNRDIRGEILFWDKSGLNEVMRLVKENDLHIQELNHENKCVMTLSLREALAEKLSVQLKQLPTLTILDQ